MGVFSRWFGAERKSGSLGVLEQLMSDHRSATGRSIGINDALDVSACLACVTAKSGDVAQLPLKFYRKARGVRTEAEDDELDEVLSRAPNPWQTAFEFWQSAVATLMLTGDAIGKITRVGGRVVEVILLEPGTFEIKRGKWPDIGPVFHVRTANGATVILPREEVFHLRGMSLNGLSGVSYIRHAREVLGLSLSLEEFSARMHRNAAKPGGLLSTENNLTDEQRKKIREVFAEQSQGTANSWRTLLLPFNIKYTPMAMSGVDMQHFESRRHQIEEVCRGMGVYPQRIGFSDKTASYASVEQFFLAYSRFQIAPEAVRIEQAIWRDFIRPRAGEEDRKVYAKFNLDALERASLGTRTDALVKLAMAGIITRNEARAFEDRNPLPGLDEPLTPLNHTPTGDANKPKPDMPKPEMIEEEMP